jgi:hypothetical protein
MARLPSTQEREPPPRRPRLHSPQRGRKRSEARAPRRRRAGLIVALFAASVLIALLTIGLGAGLRSEGCDLGSLQAVEIGQNSFVYARGFLARLDSG